MGANVRTVRGKSTSTGPFRCEDLKKDVDAVSYDDHRRSRPGALTFEVDF